MSAMLPSRQLWAQGPHIVAIGGGTGLSTMLRGLKKYTKNLTAIVTVSDDGGGSGMLRRDIGMLPPGDIRHCMEALANTEPLMSELMHYRFPEGVLAGQSFGNLLLALVVGLGSISETAQICPAASAGIRAGDVITAVNGETVRDSLHLSELCSKGGELMVTIRRDGQQLTVALTPVKDPENDTYRAGMWVRDSTSGIGTLSFCNMSSLRYGALGHPITDIDTGAIIDVGSGSIVESSIIGVSAGSNGIPGEVIGSFSTASRQLGSIELNCEYGLYGEMDEIPVNPIYPNGVKLAYPDEVHTGKAEILSTVDDRGVCAYECEIIKLYPQKEMSGKGMVIRITDRELIAKTGGIVQGMSGSPVMQDGKLIGAVTHVFVNDAKCGYCIYSWWMNRVSEKKL